VVAPLRDGRLVTDRSAGAPPSGSAGPPAGRPATATDALERIGHALRVALRDAARAENLSTTQAEVLLRLRRVGPGEPAALAAWLDVRAPTVTDALASLRAKRLVEIAADPTDARRRRVRLTATGTQAATRLEAWDAAVRREVDAAFGADEPTPRLLDVIGRLQRVGVIRVARTCVTCRFFDPARSRNDRAIAHCGLLDAPLEPETLRLDCPEHRPAA
jgi:DNA-binding MarR family transcriptional regulator